MNRFRCCQKTNPVQIQRIYLLGLILLASGLVFTLNACQPDAGIGLEGNSRPDSTPTPLALPVVVINETRPQEPPAFRPLSATDIAATATRAALSTMLESTEPISGGSSQQDVLTDSPLTSTPTVTQMPTFTPPALPQTQPWEHYWLRRPIPEGSIVWTDKAYPYGSNRGGELRPHHGVEFNVPKNTPILAAASGTVIFAGPDSEEIIGETQNFYGNVVVLQHDSGLEDQPVFSVYGHLSEILVTVGQKVHAQDQIALSGATGVADGPHLHFEVRVGENSYGATRNPLLWLYPFPDRGVVAGRILTPSGDLARSILVTLRRIDAPSAYAATTTYADDSVNEDENWQENFVLDDVVAGYYELSIGSREDKVTKEFWVYPYQTSFVELTLEN